MSLIPPQPVGQLPGSSYWNDWIEKIRSIVNSLSTGVSTFELITHKDIASGYAGLNSADRITKGVDTTDDIITDSTTKGPVMKSPNGHYWRATISNAGGLSWVDLGTTKP
jgi:hypothetical protein